MPQSSDKIVQCGECGAQNRIPLDRLQRIHSSAEKIKCGKCHQLLKIDQKQAKPSDAYKMRCMTCGTKNRVPADRIDGGATCGKCGEPLKTNELFVPQPVMVTDANMEEKVLKSPLPVLLYAWAPW